MRNLAPPRSSIRTSKNDGTPTLTPTHERKEPKFIPNMSEIWFLWVQVVWTPDEHTQRTCNQRYKCENVDAAGQGHEGSRFPPQINRVSTFLLVVCLVVIFLLVNCLAVPHSPAVSKSSCVQSLCAFSCPMLFGSDLLQL